MHLVSWYKISKGDKRRKDHQSVGWYELSKGWSKEFYSDWEETFKISFSSVSDKEAQMKDWVQEMAKTSLGVAEKVIKRKQSLKAIITISSVVAIPKTSPMWHSHMLKWSHSQETNKIMPKCWESLTGHMAPTQGSSRSSRGLSCEGGQLGQVWEGRTEPDSSSLRTGIQKQGWRFPLSRHERARMRYTSVFESRATVAELRGEISTDRKERKFRPEDRSARCVPSACLPPWWPARAPWPATV